MDTTPTSSALLTAFIAGLPPSLAARAATCSGLAALVHARVHEAMAAHPTLAIDPLAFAGALAGRLRDDDDLESTLAGLRAADLLLCFACLRGSTAALALLDDLLRRVVAPVSRRLGLAPSDADDVHQLLHEELLFGEPAQRKLASYAARGDLRAWLRVVATRLVIDHHRATVRALPLDESIVDYLGAGGATPEANLASGRYREAIRAATRRALARLSFHDKGLLWNDLRGVPAERGARQQGVRPATYRGRMAQVRAAFLHAFKQEFAAQSGIPPADSESLLRLMRSRVLSAIGEVPALLARDLGKRKYG